MKLDINKVIWIIALITGAVAVLGEYDLVVVKGLSKYNFEILLAGFATLMIARVLKK